MDWAARLAWDDKLGRDACLVIQQLHRLQILTFLLLSVLSVPWRCSRGIVHRDLRRFVVLQLSTVSKPICVGVFDQESAESSCFVQSRLPPVCAYAVSSLKRNIVEMKKSYQRRSMVRRGFKLSTSFMILLSRLHTAFSTDLQWRPAMARNIVKPVQ